jgi:uncharacterized protein (DUF1697 family)
MARWVALLRGVNVGGANKVPMAALRDLAQGLGWQGAQTHLASGNLVFQADGAIGDLAASLRAAMARALGVDVAVLVLAADDLARMLASCPFVPDEGRQVHGFFLWSPAQIDDGLYTALKAPDEVLVMADGVLWLHAPAGIGRSRLAEKLHKVIPGAQMTGRNLNTIHALVALCAAPKDWTEGPQPAMFGP